MVSSTSSSKSKDDISWLRIGVKVLILFILLNVIFVFTDPQKFLGQISLYNHLVPGRERLPYGEKPEKSYNLNLFHLDAMFKSHKLSGTPKLPSEYRVILIGDSSTWGFLLQPEETLASAITDLQLSLEDGKIIKAYNLGYPVMSLAKDLLILDRAMQFQPDMVIWLVTLESFPYDKQLFPPLLQHNSQEVYSLLKDNNLNLTKYSFERDESSLWDISFVGQRKDLANLFRLQLYGVMWAATGIDQDIPSSFEKPMEDLPNDQNFHDLTPPDLTKDDLAFEIIEAGKMTARSIPVLLVNEPMYISQGINSDIRYNYYYPRWAYDAYRQQLSDFCLESGITYIDLWNSIDPKYFTNTAVHLSPVGVRQVANQLSVIISQTANQ